MADKQVQRVDEIPLVIHWLLKMRVAEIIDHVWPYPHRNRRGLSYGQLGVLFVAYILHLRTHRLSGMEEWLEDHRQVLVQATGWEIGPKEATDDRLGDLLTVLGQDCERSVVLQRELGQHLIHAYALPTEIARFDTTTFSVHHQPAEGTAAAELLTKGHSKDRRPDLEQFKQGLGTLDPAGVPLLTGTWPGKAADDPLYLPAWREMVQTIGHRHFLFVADCKAAALVTRATLDWAGGCYLFPMPMTGEVPGQLRAWVLDPPVCPVEIVLPEVTTADGQPKVVGLGFEVEREMRGQTEDGHQHTWTERWLITRSDAHAQRQQKACLDRLRKAEAELARLKARKHDNADDLLAKAESIVQRRRVVDLVSLQVSETVTQEVRYIGPGRPGPNRPKRIIEVRQAHLNFSRNEAALEETLQLAGWRIYVTNVQVKQMSLEQAIAYYRDEWLAERGFHRFKRGSIPALPLWVRLPERITGLMLLLMIALQALTLLEFVARRSLKEQAETLDGLVPGLPKMTTDRPTAERLLARFKNLHLLLEQTEAGVKGTLVETLTPLQRRILALLHVPETVYAMEFCLPLPNY